MTKARKILVTISACVLVAAMSLGLAACGGGSSANVTDVYASNNNLQYYNFLPTGNYYTIDASAQQLELYDDGTYVLIQNDICFSNISTGPDVATGEETWNDRNQFTFIYYGDYTVVSEMTGMTTLNLAVPTTMEFRIYGCDAAYSDKVSSEDSVTWSGMITINLENLFNDMSEPFGTSGLEVYVYLTDNGGTIDYQKTLVCAFDIMMVLFASFM